MVAGALKSKTVWFGTALIILTEIKEYLPQFAEAMPNETYDLVLKGIGLAIILLRVVTTQPLSEK